MSMSHENVKDEANAQKNTIVDVQKKAKSENSDRKVLFVKKRTCLLSKDEIEQISYKNPMVIAKCISEGGRILPRKFTGLSNFNQRRLKKAIKVARVLGLLQFVLKTI